jgi:hypothetical protein
MESLPFPVLPQFQVLKFPIRICPSSRFNVIFRDKLALTARNCYGPPKHKARGAPLVGSLQYQVAVFSFRIRGRDMRRGGNFIRHHESIHSIYNIRWFTTLRVCVCVMLFSRRVNLCVFTHLASVYSKLCHNKNKDVCIILLFSHRMGNSLFYSRKEGTR